MSATAIAKYRVLPEAKGFSKTYLSHEATLQLIAAVKKREPIWYQSNKSYYINDLKLCIWNSIIAELFDAGCKDADCAVATWENLLIFYYLNASRVHMFTDNDVNYFKEMMFLAGQSYSKALQLTVQEFYNLPIIKKHFYKHPNQATTSQAQQPAPVPQTMPTTPDQMSYPGSGYSGYPPCGSGMRGPSIFYPSSFSGSYSMSECGPVPVEALKYAEEAYQYEQHHINRMRQHAAMMQPTAPAAPAPVQTVPKAQTQVPTGPSNPVPTQPCLNQQPGYPYRSYGNLPGYPTMHPNAPVAPSGYFYLPNYTAMMRPTAPVASAPAQTGPKNHAETQPQTNHASVNPCPSHANQPGYYMMQPKTPAAPVAPGPSQTVPKNSTPEQFRMNQHPAYTNQYYASHPGYPTMMQPTAPIAPVPAQTGPKNPAQAQSYSNQPGYSAMHHTMHATAPAASMNPAQAPPQTNQPLRYPYQSGYSSMMQRTSMGPTQNSLTPAQTTSVPVYKAPVDVNQTHCQMVKEKVDSLSQKMNQLSSMLTASSSSMLPHPSSYYSSMGNHIRSDMAQSEEETNKMANVSKPAQKMNEKKSDEVPEENLQSSAVSKLPKIKRSSSGHIFKRRNVNGKAKLVFQSKPNKAREVKSIIDTDTTTKNEAKDGIAGFVSTNEGIKPRSVTFAEPVVEKMRIVSDENNTESSISLDVITVTLNMDTANFLGISIVGENYHCGDNQIYVANILKGGAVALDGRIEAGDMILRVNDKSFENLTNDQAVDLLREAVANRGLIKLTAAKGFDSGSKSAIPGIHRLIQKQLNWKNVGKQYKDETKTASIATVNTVNDVANPDLVATQPLATEDITATEAPSVVPEQALEAAKVDPVIQNTEVTSGRTVAEEAPAVIQDQSVIQNAPAPRTDLSTTDHFIIHIISILISMFLYHYFST